MRPKLKHKRSSSSITRRFRHFPFRERCPFLFVFPCSIQYHELLQRRHSVPSQVKLGTGGCRPPLLAGNSLPPTAPRQVCGASPAKAHEVVIIYKVGIFCLKLLVHGKGRWIQLNYRCEGYSEREREREIIIISLGTLITLIIRS